jgi:hypothetical protein
MDNLRASSSRGRTIVIHPKAASWTYPMQYSHRATVTILILRFPFDLFRSTFSRRFLVLPVIKRNASVGCLNGQEKSLHVMLTGGGRN